MIRIRGLAIRVSSIVICILLSLSLFNFSFTAVPNMLSVENTRIITNPSNSDQVLQNTRSWTNGEFTNFNTTDRLPSNNIRDLLWDSGNNRLFIATNKGLAIFNTNNRSFITKNVSDGMLRDDINSLAFDSERNVLYLGAFDCLSFYDITNDTFTNKDMGSTWQTPPRVLAFNPLRNDLYIGLRSVSLEETGSEVNIHEGFIIYDVDTDTFINKSLGHSYGGANSVSDFALDIANQILWIGNGDSPFSVPSMTFFVYNISTDILSKKEGATVRSLALDSLKNHLWMGTIVQDNGWHEYLSIYDPEDGSIEHKVEFYHDGAFSLALDNKTDRVYAGMYSFGLVIYEILGDSYTIKNETHGLPSNKITSLALDSIHNRLYIGTNNGLSICNLYYSLHPINYTQIVLDFIQEHYPNQTVELSNTWEYVTYETNVSYTIVEAMVYYDGIESVDIVTASINHVTKHIEFGREQIQRDYQEYVDSLPIYYQKMESGFRTDIRNDVGFLPTINESKNFSLRYDAVFIINATDLRKMYDAMDIVGAGQEYEYIEEVNWLYGTKSVRINLTLYQTLFIGNYSFVIYLYRESTKYTQMCLDFIQKHYPDETVTLRVKGEHITPETGAKYTIVKSRLLPSKQTIVASVNHATNHIELGRGQIYRDYQEYIDSLPRPYQKMGRESRFIIKDEFGYFPTINEVENLNYRCKVTFTVWAANLSKLTDAINVTGETYSDIWSFGPVNGENLTEVDANLTFYHILMLANESFVKAFQLRNIIPYTIEEKYDLVNAVLISIIVVLLIVVAIQSFILFRMRKKK